MIEELKELGLGNYESKALEILLKEKITLRNLSKKSQIPFATIEESFGLIDSARYDASLSESPLKILADSSREVLRYQEQQNGKGKI